MLLRPKSMELPPQSHRLFAYLNDALQNAGVENAAFEARMILEERAGLKWADIMSEKTPPLSAEIIDKISSDLEQRISGTPLSRIYQEREFWGLRFGLNEHTLDPRSDTEVLVELALKKFKDQPPGRFLDLGTGTGCIAAALLSSWPQAQALALDISPGALAQAQKNFKKNGLSERVDLICGDWADCLADEVDFDLVVSNPPYISESELESLDENVKNYDPILALSGGEDGLQAYRKIFLQLFALLRPGGTGLFEIGYAQGEDVMRLAEESGFSEIRVHPDLAGRARVVEISRGDK